MTLFDFELARTSKIELNYLHIYVYRYLLSCHIRQNSRPFLWRYSCYFLALSGEMKDPILHAFHD